MKISKRTREQAALICAIAAGGGVHIDDANRRTCVYGEIRIGGGFPEDALRLALHAYVKACGSSAWTREADAEAEALLRTGSCPGDEP